MAQRQLTLAHAGEAGRLAPAELLVADRTLRAAERAHDDSPDTTEARDLAYIAHRQTLVAQAHARSIAIGESTDEQQADYTDGLEASNRDAQREQQGDRRMIERQQSEIAQAETDRDEAEARADEAVRRLSAFASVQEAEGETTITILGSVLFRSGGSELLAGAAPRLAAVADALNTQPTRNITVEGFTDSRGSDTQNQVLSLARADSVRTVLLSHGVESSRIRTVGVGEARPTADNATAEGRANNRRVEIVLGATSESDVVSSL
jgi:outer membrane protein OmpA-like peptidoglycan-associated protein